MCEKVNKYKIKALVPQYVYEVIKKDSEYLNISFYGLCNLIIKKFSFNINTSYSLEFDEKKSLQFELQKKVAPYYQEIINTQGLKYDLNESQIVRNIFINYALLPPFMREITLFKQEIAYILNNESKIYVLSTGLIEGKAESILIDKKTNHLKIIIDNKEYGINKIELI